MKATYRGCQVEAYREKALGGWSEVYWSAFTADGGELNSGFGGGTVREMFREMKETVDSFFDEYQGDFDRWCDDSREYALALAGLNGHAVGPNHKSAIEERQQIAL